MRVAPHNYGESILLAVSGGVDSIVMASLCVKAWNAVFGNLDKIALAHCNFNLRGEESDGDEAFVREWAAAQGVRCFVERFDTKAYAQASAQSVEMAARQLRYEWFDSLCAKEGYVGVCVAHNANDNAETLLLNLLRGCGLKGACGMKEVSANPFGKSKVFRPLLQYSRAQIEEYALKEGISWRTDSTNGESEVKRNIIRNRVFPILEELNPSFIQTLNRDIDNFSEAETALELSLDACVVEGDRICIETLKENPAWEYLLFSKLYDRGFHPSTARSVVDLLGSERIVGGKTFSGRDCQLITTSRELLFQDGAPAEPSVKITCEDWVPGSDPRTKRGTIILDADALPSGEPQLRPWKEGDYLQPIGLKGKKKVSDLLTDLHYDISQKETALVVSGEGSHVLAVVGERVDVEASVTSKTRRIYRIEIS